MSDELLRPGALRRSPGASEKGGRNLRVIVQAASRLLGTPLAAIATVGETRLRILASTDPLLHEMLRRHPFFDQIVRGRTAISVEDAQADPRYCESPLVHNLPSIRSYAGTPIFGPSGEAEGLLFVAATTRRRFGAAELSQLEELAQIAADRIRIKNAPSVKDAPAGHPEPAAAPHGGRQPGDDSCTGSWLLDLETRNLTFSPAIRRLFHIPREAQASLETCLAQFDGEWRETMRTRIERLAASGQAFDVEAMVRTRKGERRLIRCVADAERNSGRIARIFGGMVDLTASEGAQAELTRMATRDPLTGLLNRRAVEARFSELAAELLPGQSILLALVDIDHFKLVNDIDGHEAGDRLLTGFAALLERAAGSGAEIGRIGGDEFIVMRVESAHDKGAGAWRTTVQQVLENTPGLWQAASSKISVSIGSTIISGQGATFAKALKQADLALYESKRRGRAQATQYNAGLGEAFAKRMSLFQQVEQGLINGEFEPFYQPQFDVKTRNLFGFEALARWRRGGEALSPGAFWEALEDPELGTRISDSILARALADAGSWRRQGFEFKQMAVNVTDRQLLDEGFEERIDELLAENGLAPQDLTLELTERILMSRHADTLRARLNSFSKKGVSIAFDDFGTGFASLSHLRDFKIHQLKLDRSFIAGLDGDRDAFAIVMSVVMMAKALRIQTVGEGVESFRTHCILRNLGCCVAQGFHYARPVAEDEAVLYCETSAEHRKSPPVQSPPEPDATLPELAG